MPDSPASRGEDSAWLSFPVAVDESIPEDTIRIEAAQTHLVKLRPGGAEFVGGPLDGTEIRDA